MIHLQHFFARPGVYYGVVVWLTMWMTLRRWVKRHGMPRFNCGFKTCFNCQKDLSRWRRFWSESDYCSKACREDSVEFIQRLAANRLVTKGPVMGFGDRPVFSRGGRLSSYTGPTLLRLSHALMKEERRRRGDHLKNKRAS